MRRDSQFFGSACRNNAHFDFKDDGGTAAKRRPQSRERCRGARRVDRVRASARRRTPSATPSTRHFGQRRASKWRRRFGHASPTVSRLAHRIRSSVVGAARGRRRLTQREIARAGAASVTSVGRRSDRCRADGGGAGRKLERKNLFTTQSRKRHRQFAAAAAQQCRRNCER